MNIPQAEGDPYYPVPRPENAEIYKKYQQLASAMTNTYFVGRLATYKYYNMDQVVAQSLTLFKKLMQRQPETHVNGQKITTNKVGNPELWGGIECTINRIRKFVLISCNMQSIYQRENDLSLIAELGIKTLRYPVLWEHHQPAY